MSKIEEILRFVASDALKGQLPDILLQSRVEQVYAAIADEVEGMELPLEIQCNIMEKIVPSWCPPQYLFLVANGIAEATIAQRQHIVDLLRAKGEGDD